MTERLSAVGGALTLYNEPDGGLTVTAVLPRHPDRKRASAAAEGKRP
jgi:hypothetical protein